MKNPKTDMAGMRAAKSVAAWFGSMSADGRKVASFDVAGRSSLRTGEIQYAEASSNAMSTSRA